MGHFTPDRYSPGDPVRKILTVVQAVVCQLSALLPGEPLKAPAVDAAAVVVVIQVAFKTLVNMKYPGEVILQQFFTRFQGTFARTTDQDYRGATFIGGADGAAKKQFSDVGDEMGVFHPVGLVDPGYMDRPLGMAHKQVLHAGAYIHQDGARVILQQLPRLFGRQTFGFVFAHVQIL